MRWLTIPLRRDSDVVSARSRLISWADALGLEGFSRTRAVTLGAELSRFAISTGDASIEFGWDSEAERSFCTIDVPASTAPPPELMQRDSVSTPDETTVVFEVLHEKTRTKFRIEAPSKAAPDVVQRAVAETPEASAIELLKEQNMEMARMLGTLRDREAELCRALEEAQQSANEAHARELQLNEVGKRKDEILAIAAHDLRSPIAAAKGALELLEPTLKGLSDDQIHLLGVARRAADAVTHLLSNLLSTALIEVEDDAANDAGGVDLTQITREIMEMMGIQARQKAIEVAFEASPALPAVRGDLMWVRQIVSNLVNNAVKFTPKGGHVSIGITQPNESELLFIIEDDGVGIPPDKVDRVFEKLTKLRPRGTAGERGTGIGLYVAKQLADRLRGTISVSTPASGAGARFELRLPLAPDRISERASGDGRPARSG